MSRVKRHSIKKKAEKPVPKKEPFMTKKMLWTFIIGGLMVASVFGIMFSSFNSGQEENTYGDYTFSRTKFGWATEIDGKQAEFDYLPQDVEELNVSAEVIQKLVDSRVLYITFDPNSKIVDKFELMRYRFSGALGDSFGKYVMPGVTNHTEAYAGQPLVDCGNATAATPVIHVTEGNETVVVLDGDCITIEAYEFAVGAVKDRLLYGMFGILE
ncbi:hypothetical protein ACFL3V_04570 [Nanoarchaeota archaeon]